MLDTLRSTFKSSLIYGLGNVSIKVIGLILFPIYTKELTVSDYGVLGMLEVTSQLFVAFFAFNLHAALLRFYYSKEFSQKKGSMVFSSLIFLMISILVMISLAFPLSKFLSARLLHDDQFANLIKLMLISSGIQIFNTIPSTLLRILEKASYYSISMVIRLLATLFLTIYLMVNLGKGIEGIYLAQIAGHILYFLTVAVVIIRNIKIEFSVKVLYSMLAFSMPLVFSSVANILLSVLDRFCLSFLGDMADVGIYSAGFKIANALQLVFASFQLAVIPVVYKKIHDPDSKRFYSKIFTYSAYGGMILVLGLSLFGKEIIKFLAQDPEYWLGYKIIPIISYGLFFSMLRYFATTGLNIALKTRTIALYTVAVAVLNTGLNLWLISWFNYIGAAIATLISHIIFLILIFKRSQKVFPIPYEVRKIYLILIVSLVLLFAGYLADDLSLLLRLIIKSGLIILFPLGLYLLKFYEEIELVRIRQAWEKWSRIITFRKRR